MEKVRIEKLEVNSPLRPQVESIFNKSFPEFERVSLEPFFSKDIPEAEIFAAAAGNEVFGFYSMLHEAPYFYLFYIAVDPERRGHGVGGLMIESFLKQAEGNLAFLDCEALYPNCSGREIREARLALYNRHEFTPVGPMKAWRGENFLTLVHGGKNISEEEIQCFWEKFDKLWAGQDIATVPDESAPNEMN